MQKPTTRTISFSRHNVFEEFSSKMCGVDKDDCWASKYAKTIKAKNGISQYLQKY